MIEVDDVIEFVEVYDYVNFFYDFFKSDKSVVRFKSLNDIVL